MAERRTIKINGYPIDLARSEDIRYPSKITPHAVESGTDFVDHIHNDGIEITLECVVSDTPIGRIATDPTRQFFGDNAPTPSEDARARMIATRDARQPFTIETSKGTFEKMGLMELSEVSNSTTTGGLTFTAKFLQISIKTNRRTLVRIASRLPGGVVDLGIVLDRLVDGQVTLWRKGIPPGRGPNTDPPGGIVGSEIVFCRRGKILHSDDKTELTPLEMKRFKLDLERDSQGFETRSEMAKTQAAKKNQAAAATVKRAQDYQNAQVANPGKKVDPALFGLTGKPKALDPGTVPANSTLRGPDGPLGRGPV